MDLVVSFHHVGLGLNSGFSLARLTGSSHWPISLAHQKDTFEQKNYLSKAEPLRVSVGSDILRMGKDHEQGSYF